MPIDPSIISGIKQYQAPNILSMANEAARLQMQKYGFQRQQQLDKLADQKAHVEEAIKTVAGYANEQDALNGLSDHYKKGNIDDSTYNQILGVFKQGTDWSTKQQQLLMPLLSAKEQLDFYDTQRQQQQFKDIMSGGLQPTPAAVQPAGTNALAPTPAPSVNALDPNAVNKQITALYALGTPQAMAQAKYLESQLTAQAKDITSKPTQVDVGGSIKTIDMNPNSPTFKKELLSFTKTQTPAQAQTSGAPTDLKPGERWNPTNERVEQVPGSAEYNKQSKAHGTDYDALNTTKTVTKDNVANVDALLKAGNAWATETNNGTKKLSSNASDDAKAFANLFPGSYIGYATQYYSGKTASLKATYDKLQATAKGLGLGRLRVGGSIGTITQQEWPIIGAQVLSLSPKMQTADAVAEISSIKNKFIDTEAQAVDKYDTIWGDTQYYKTPPTDGTKSADTGDLTPEEQAELDSLRKKSKK